MESNKTTRLFVRLTDTEKKDLQEKAKAANLSLSNYVRQLIWKPVDKN